MVTEVTTSYFGIHLQCSYEPCDYLPVLLFGIIPVLLFGKPGGIAAVLQTQVTQLDSLFCGQTEPGAGQKAGSDGGPRGLPVLNYQAMLRHSYSVQVVGTEQC